VTDVVERHVDYWPLSKVLKAPRNPKRHDAPTIANSITRFGLAELPTIDERTGCLVAGHGRIEDLEHRSGAGQDPPPGIRTDPETGEWLVPLVRGWASETDEEADAYVVISNKSTMNGGWDDLGLAQILADLATGPDATLVGLTGFPAGELEDLLALLDQPVMTAAPPTSDAHYAEDEAAFDERTARIEGYKPRSDPDTGGAITEMILVYATDDRAEVTRLVQAARENLGELRAAEVVLRGLRLLVAALDMREDPRPVPVGSLLRAAGWGQ
jgi:hypothetical protein